MAVKRADQKLQAWSDARARHHLTDAQVRMARELGMNPVKLGKVDHNEQERWKRPLPQFIEDAYRKRFGKTTTAMSVAEPGRGDHEKKKAHSIKQERDQPAGRENRETPRGSTFPAFPKQRIDD
jgi:hypothetical protein